VSASCRCTCKHIPCESVLRCVAVSCSVLQCEPAMCLLAAAVPASAFHLRVRLTVCTVSVCIHVVDQLLVRVWVCLSVNIYIHTNIYIHIYIYVCMYMYTYMYVCMYVCLSLSICIFIYIYIHMLSSLFFPPSLLLLFFLLLQGFQDPEIRAGHGTKTHARSHTNTHT
jgi:hypothetical protein